MSKIFERLLAKRLNAFAEVNNLFPNQQFGFRKGLGACDAVLTISDRVLVLRHVWLDLILVLLLIVLTTMH